jgi:hypothetical protein
MRTPPLASVAVKTYPRYERETRPASQNDGQSWELFDA